MALNKESNIFMMYVVVLKALLVEMSIYSDKKAQITFLLIKKVTIQNKYSDFADVFSKKKAFVLLKQTDLNKHTIKLGDGKQLLYRPIYSLGLVKLEILKTNIKTYLKTGFI